MFYGAVMELLASKQAEMKLNKIQVNFTQEIKLDYKFEDSEKEKVETKEVETKQIEKEVEKPKKEKTKKKEEETPIKITKKFIL